MLNLDHLNAEEAREPRLSEKSRVQEPVRSVNGYPVSFRIDHFRPAATQTMPWHNRPLIPGATQRCRRRFPEEPSICDRKASELPEPIIARDSGNGFCGRIGSKERRTREIHAPQVKITNWPHAKMFAAMGA